MNARAWYLPLGLAALIALSGCGTHDDAEPPIRFGVASGPRSLDPRLATDAASERVNRLLYQRLVELDASGLPQPGLARWEQHAPTHYRFHLGEEGRIFADGSRLDAGDIAATLESVRDPRLGSPQAAALAAVARIEVLDPETLDLWLHAPDPYLLASLGIGILPAAGLAAGHAFADRPMGSGPLRLLDWPAPGRLRMERRADGQVIELLTVKDPNVRVMKLLRGEVDLLQNDLPPELVNLLENHDGVTVERRDGHNLSYLGFNLEDATTGRLEVRAAIAHAIDREVLLTYLFHGLGRTAEELFPPEHWLGEARAPAYPHDPERARALLATLGHGPEHPLDITMKTSNDPFRLRVAAALQHQLSQVGIRLTIRSYDWGTFFGDIREGRFQFYGLTWVGVRLPDIYRYAFHSDAIPPRGANRGRYRNAAVDRLIETAQTLPDLAEQEPVYRALQALLRAELPYIPLWYESQILARREHIQGYTLAADGNYLALQWVRRAAPEDSALTARDGQRP